MSVDAVRLGISYEDYWSLYPSSVIELCEAKLVEREEQMDEKLFTSWLTSYYTSLGFNSPKNFPKKPRSMKEMNKTEEQKQIELGEDMLRIKKLLSKTK